MADNALTITPQQPAYQYASYWPWLTGLFATLWLITLILWRKAVSQQNLNIARKTIQRPVADVASLATITDACDRNNVSDVISGLQRYFSAILQRQVTLTEISQLSEPLNQALSDLQQSRYSKHATTINKSQLINALKSYHHSKNTPSDPVIAKLNP